ncbi:proton pump-interactor BIP131-like [Gossypium hirsutum]|uniref:Proton pump-interactor BIP131-like n=1 Tax=Gossypium hirsutum TaxID=3635 RepID=A0ABM3BIR2_GOSHI|nr:proton pump-interactor BIP131-like [Gossypium hirsutum]
MTAAKIKQSCKTEFAKLKQESSFQHPAKKTCGVTNGGIQFGSFDDKAERETPFNYMIRVPRNDDERLKVMIRLARNKVDEKIRIQRMLHIDMQSTWVTSEEYRNDFSDAAFQEQVARDLHRSKCQEIEWMQSVIDIEDIEVKIRDIEWTIQHQTLPLKDEKLSSTMSRQEENQQGLDRKERLKSLKKEADQLRANLINAVAITEVTRRKYYKESEKLSESLYLLKAADDNQEEAYAQLQSLKKQLYEKNQHFRQYRDDFIKANELGWKGDKVALQNFCINQVEKFMDLWNNNDEFRKEYVRCNERSTLWRLRTLDGRALGPGEVPPVIHRAVNGRALVDHTMSGLTLEDRTQELVAVAKAEKVLAEKVVEQKKFMKSAPPESVSTTASNGDKIEEAEEEKPERTKEADESDRKAEELRKEEEAAKLKEQRQLEEIAKAEEAQERKRQKAEKKREKRAKNKENQKAVATAGDTGIEDEAVSACPTSETLAETSKETENKEKPMVATTGTPQKVSKFDSKPVTLGWRYPPHGWLKFNVSGMATKEAMGCGGVLRDKEGNVRALFSGPCDAINADSTELGAIITSLYVIIEIGWRGTGLIIVEIGSLVAYN